MNKNLDFEIGTRLREVRTRHGFSQRELARRARVSNATISMIEANRVSPSVSALKQILSGIPIGLSEFFAISESEPEKIVFKASDLTEIGGGLVSYRQVGSDLSGRSLQLLHERYKPGASSGHHSLRHHGEEAGIVIRGRLLLEVDGRRHELGPGDAYAFDSRRPHSFKNVGDTDLVVISACTPPTF
ncbi:MAG: cupin domain-containing protein [Hyphomicrobium sp.]|jgi:transcriptional regulator with XRE-family HTH domain